MKRRRQIDDFSVYRRGRSGSTSARSRGVASDWPFDTGGLGLSFGFLGAAGVGGLVWSYLDDVPVGMFWDQWNVWDQWVILITDLYKYIGYKLG